MSNILGVGIGIVYAGLLQKALSVYFKKEETDNMCGERNIWGGVAKYDKDCENERTNRLKEIDIKTFVPAMTISILTIILSVIIRKQNDMLSYGLGLGAIISLIYNVIINWYRFDDKQRLTTYTISFVILVGVALKYFKNI